MRHHFAGFQLHDVSRAGSSVVALVVEDSPQASLFSKAGTYERPNEPGKSERRIAFREAVLDIRHDAKSEPATSFDLED
jgi:hypothetical protein